MDSSNQALTDSTNRCASQRFIFSSQTPNMNQYPARSGWNHFKAIYPLRSILNNSPFKLAF